MESLKKAIELSGGQSSLASAIGFSPQVVNNWLRRGGVPEEHCPSIERATSGAVTCEELLPGVAWVRIPDPDWPHPNGRPLVDHTQQKKAA